MKCPVCGTQLPQDATICPACHSKIYVSTKKETERSIFCRRCGAKVPDGKTTCPYCGFPLTDEDVVRTLERHHEPKKEAPRAVSPESVIPDAPTDGYRAASRLEHMPHIRVALVAALSSVLIVGGAFLAVTKPWDPNSRITHATEDRDTSWAGFPGAVETLSGQDKAKQQQEQEQRDIYFDELTSFWQALGSISQEMDENEATLTGILDGSGESISDGAAQSQQIALELSNKIADFSSYDMRDSDYVDQYNNLVNLGNYLRNRSDALNQAWQQAAAAEDITDVSQQIDAMLGINSDGTGAATWKQLFEQGYSDAEPQEL
ncbi:MAG: zinc-ribbon domain-containing protein [Atopobiaceae bacterium]